MVHNEADETCFVRHGTWSQPLAASPSAGVGSGHFLADRVEDQASGLVRERENDNTVICVNAG